MIAITVSVGFATSSNGARQLQASPNPLGDGISTALALQIASVLGNLGKSIGPVDPIATADTEGNYRYDSILSEATTGLSPPSRTVLSQLGPWLVSLDKNLRISQLSSVVFTSDTTMLVMSADTAMSISAAILTNTPGSPTTTPSSAGASSSTAGAIVGVFVALSVVASGISFYIYRRRKQYAVVKEKSRLAEKKKVQAFAENSFRQPMNPPSTARRDLVPIHIPLGNISKSRVISFLPSVEEAGKNKTEIDILSAEKQTNAMKYFSQVKSVPNILRTQSIRRPIVSEEEMQGRIATASSVVEDENGRRGFTSSGVRHAPRPLSLVKKPIEEEASDKESDGSRHKSRRRINSEEEVQHKSRSRHKSRRRVDSEEEEVQHKSTSRRRSSSKAKDRDSFEPVQNDKVNPLPEIEPEVKPEPIPEVKPEPIAEVKEEVKPEVKPEEVEKPRIKKSKSKTVVTVEEPPVEVVVPVPVPVEETPKPRLKKSKSKKILEAPASPVVVEVSPQEEVKLKRRKSKSKGSIVVPEPVPLPEPEPEAVEEPNPEEPKPKIKKSKSKSKLDTPQ